MVSFCWSPSCLEYKTFVPDYAFSSSYYYRWYICIRVAHNSCFRTYAGILMFLCWEWMYHMDKCPYCLAFKLFHQSPNMDCWHSVCLRKRQKCTKKKYVQLHYDRWQYDRGLIPTCFTDRGLSTSHSDFILANTLTLVCWFTQQQRHSFFWILKSLLFPSHNDCQIFTHFLLFTFHHLLWRHTSSCSSKVWHRSGDIPLYSC